MQWNRGDIFFAFSTANRIARHAKETEGMLNLQFISGQKVTLRFAPPITTVQEILARCDQSDAEKVLF